MLSARILGSAGFLPSDERETSCLLVRGDDPSRALVVDGGTGIRRLVTDPSLVAGVRELHVVLTHFHIDHIYGLGFLGALDDTHVVVHGPGAASYGRPTEEILGGVYRAPVFPLEYFADEVRELEPGDTTIAGIPVRARRQDQHPDPTMGLRFGDALAWCTDTAYDPGIAEFARGVEVLCHDAWGFGEEPEETVSHTTGAQAAAVAAEAGVPRLVLIHLPPIGLDELLAEASAGHPDVCLAHDGLSLLGS